MNELLAAVEKVNQMADGIVRQTPELGPTGGRHLSRSAGIAIVTWIVLYFSARLVLESTSLPVPLRLTVAVLPVPAFAWFLWAFISGVRDADELERRIQLEALAVTVPLILLLLMTLGLLQLAVPLNPDDWSYHHIWPFVFLFYMVGLAVARRCYL